MSIRFRRPSEEVLSALLEQCRSDSLTYVPVGMAKLATAPPGYRLDRFSRSLGHGDDVFVRACDALRRWRVHARAGLTVRVEGPPVVGRDVVMSAPMPAGFIDVACRVVGTEDDGDRFGFTYGTLSVHPEQGEESFTVVRSPGGEVHFEVVAVSRPRHVLAKLGGPVARRLQRAATVRYLDAMQADVTS